MICIFCFNDEHMTKAAEYIFYYRHVHNSMLAEVFQSTALQKLGFFCLETAVNVVQHCDVVIIWCVHVQFFISCLEGNTTT